MATTFGKKLDPYFFARTAFGVNGNRQSYVVTNNPSSIDANEYLTVCFPNLRANDVIVPGTARLAFNITLNGGTDANRTSTTRISTSATVTFECVKMRE